MNWIYDDAGVGRAASRRDCVCRAITIASERPYAEVWNELKQAAARERPRAGKARSHPSAGVHLPTIRAYLAGQGWLWVPTMRIGQGCTTHLRRSELPTTGRLIVSVSKHITAVIDGVIHDTHDPSRRGTRCVYGYWVKEPSTGGEQ
jgi:hypothetical protein